MSKFSNADRWDKVDGYHVGNIIGGKKCNSVVELAAAIHLFISQSITVFL